MLHSGAVTPVNEKRFERLVRKWVPEFAEKRVLFSRDEMQII
jgi:hypothetical protein